MNRFFPMIRKNELCIIIKGGISDGALLDEKGVGVLASMPGPNELKAMFLALLNTPATLKTLTEVPGFAVVEHDCYAVGAPLAPKSGLTSQSVCS